MKNSFKLPIKFLSNYTFTTLLGLFVFTFSISAQNTERPENVNFEEAKVKTNSKLLITTLIQPRVMTGEKYSSFALKNNYDTVDFNFRRIRLTSKFQGADWYGGIISLKGENMLSEGKSGIQEANIWLKTKDSLVSIFTIGQFKLPFLREQMSSSSKLISLEKAFSSETLQAQDIGLRYKMQPLGTIVKNYKDLMLIYLSVTNGDGSGQNGVGRKEVEASNKYNSPLYNWRLQFNFLGSLDKKNNSVWNEGNEIFSKRLQFSFGYGGALTPDYEYNSNGLLNNGEDLLANAFDMIFSYYHFYFSAAYTVFTRAAAENNTVSYQTTCGYNFTTGNIGLMPVLRFDYFQADLNKNNSIGNGESVNDIWLGINFFGNKHNMKVQLFYQIHSNKNIQGFDKEDNVFYLQFSSYFEKRI